MRAAVVHVELGQSAVEFALVLPILLLILSGLVDFGRLYYSYITVANAAQVGAQHGAVSPGYASNSSGIRNAALAETTSLWGANSSNPAVTSATGVDASGYQYVTVVVSYTFSTIFPYPVMSSQVPVSRTAQMRVQQ